MLHWGSNMRFTWTLRVSSARLGQLGRVFPVT